MKWKTISLVLGIGCAVSACTLTARRPVQEMSNAEAAIHAAKDLNADSLVPELYRSAIDNHFKAKREYRLKNFDEAQKYALRAMHFAEQAEFEAYRMGGATPETASSSIEPEGASPDAESSFKQLPADEEPTIEDSPKPRSSEPSLQKEEPGLDFEVHKQEREEEQKAKEDSEKKKKPEGQVGPTTPTITPTDESKSPLTPKPGSDPYFWVKQRPAARRENKKIPALKSEDTPLMSDHKMPSIHSESPLKQEGLDPIDRKPMPKLEGEEIEVLNKEKEEP